MNLSDVVALVIDLPDQGLRRGQVEFADTSGVAYVMVALQVVALMTLYWHPDSAQQTAA